MNKRIKILIVSILIFLILGIQLSKVIAVTNNGFFYTNKEEISQGEVLEMTLDISKIKYDKFEFKLSSNLDTNNIVVNEDIKAESYNNDISINIDKSKTNLDKITFYYQVPQNSQIGTKIELVAQIIVAEEKKIEQNTVATNELNIANNTNTLNNNQVDNTNTINNTNIENTVPDTNTTESNTTEIAIEYKVVDSKQIDVKIVEKKQNNNQEKPNEQINNDKNNFPNEKENTNSFEKNDKPNNTNIQNNNETNKMSANFEVNLSTNTNKSMPSTNVQNISYSANTMNLSSMPSQAEAAVYNGSNNNYLSSLEIEGEKLNTTFNKENTTYFVQINGKIELNVKATAEDDESKIYVTGNENLKKGENKILISVTAENGDVRYYRVFVTNN